MIDLDSTAVNFLTVFGVSYVRRTRAFILGLVLVLPSPAWAAASIVGTLTDPSGATIPGATVIVSHRGTAAERQVESNSLGDFALEMLPPGQYQITILKPGFRKTVSSDITLNVDQTLRFDAVLICSGPIHLSRPHSAGTPSNRQ